MPSNMPLNIVETVMPAVLAKVPGEDVYLTTSGGGFWDTIKGVRVNPGTWDVAQIGTAMPNFPTIMVGDVYPAAAVPSAPARYVVSHNQPISGSSPDAAKPMLRSWVLDHSTLAWSHAGDLDVAYTGNYYTFNSFLVATDDDGHLYFPTTNYGDNTIKHNRAQLLSDGSFANVVTTNGSVVADGDRRLLSNGLDGSDLLPHVRPQMGLNSGMRVNDIRDPTVNRGSQADPGRIVISASHEVPSNYRKANQPGHNFYAMAAPVIDRATNQSVDTPSGESKYAAVKGHLDPITYLDVVEEQVLLADGLVPNSTTTLASGCVVIAGQKYSDTHVNLGLFVLWDVFGNQVEYLFPPDYPGLQSGYPILLSASDTEDVLLLRPQPTGTAATTLHLFITTIKLGISGALGPTRQRFT